MLGYIIIPSILLVAGQGRKLKFITTVKQLSVLVKIFYLFFSTPNYL